MFEHLDDPDGFVPAADFKSRVLRAGRRRRRRGRAVRVGGAGALVVVGLLATVVIRVDRRLDDIERVDVAGLAPESHSRSEPQTVLVVGVDSRDGEALPEGAGRVVGSRSDTMVLVRVDPAEDRLTVLPLPRDLWVDIPGQGPSRLNAAIATGGPSLLVDTIRSDLGIAVDRYVQIDFVGTRAIADLVGGLRLGFDRPVRDLPTGLELDAGCQDLDGEEVLALARARHLQHRDADGSWASDPGSDLSRIERQQVIGEALVAALTRIDSRDPRAALDLVDAAAAHLTIDSALSNAELVDLLRVVIGAEVTSLRLPVTGATRGGAAVLERDAAAPGVLDSFRTGSPGPTADSRASWIAGVLVPTPC